MFLHLLQCSEGFTGRYCNETEGPCNPNPCAENGLCRRVNVTVNSPLGGGNSSHITETYNCSCYAGWRGINCTEDINECKENGLYWFISYLKFKFRYKCLVTMRFLRYFTHFISLTCCIYS